LEKLCRDVQAQAVLYQESIRDASELEDTTGVELLQGRTGGHARPMVVIKQVCEGHASKCTICMLGALKTSAVLCSHHLVAACDHVC
jgi:hypothetical protein